jgi:hypothetical protein
MMTKLGDTEFYVCDFITQPLDFRNLGQRLPKVHTGIFRLFLLFCLFFVSTCYTQTDILPEG